MLDKISKQFGYENHPLYLEAFKTPEGRADMADRFCKKADELGIDLGGPVYYE